jgi:hypothetical protein
MSVGRLRVTHLFGPFSSLERSRFDDFGHKLVGLLHELLVLLEGSHAFLQGLAASHERLVMIGGDWRGKRQLHSHAHARGLSAAPLLTLKMTRSRPEALASYRAHPRTPTHAQPRVSVLPLAASNP